MTTFSRWLLLVLILSQFENACVYSLRNEDYYELSEAKITQICSYVGQSCSSCKKLKACFWCQSQDGSGKCIANLNRRSRYNCLGQIYDRNRFCEAESEPMLRENSSTLKREREKALLIKLIHMLRQIRSHQAKGSRTDAIYDLSTPAVLPNLSASRKVSPSSALNTYLSEMIKAENDKLYHAYSLKTDRPRKIQKELLNRLLKEYLSSADNGDSQENIALKYLKVLQLLEKYQKNGKPVIPTQPSSHATESESVEEELENLEEEMNAGTNSSDLSLPLFNPSSNLINQTSTVLPSSSVPSDWNMTVSFNSCVFINQSSHCNQQDSCIWCRNLSRCLNASESCGTVNLSSLMVTEHMHADLTKTCQAQTSCSACVKDTTCYWCSKSKSCHFFPGPDFVPDSCKNYMFHNVCSYQVTLLIVLVPIIFIVVFMGVSYFCVKHCYYHQRKPVEVNLEEKPILFKTKNGRTIYQITESEEEDEEKYAAENSGSQYQQSGKTKAVMW